MADLHLLKFPPTGASSSFAAIRTNLSRILVTAAIFLVRRTEIAAARLVTFLRG
jgi:hypothetical protein